MRRWLASLEKETEKVETGTKMIPGWRRRT